MKTRFCTSCGSGLPGGVAYCTACGAPVTGGPAAPRQPASRVTIAIALVLPLAAAGAVFLLTRGGSGSGAEGFDDLDATAPGAGLPWATDVVGETDPSPPTTGAFTVGPAEQIAGAVVGPVGGTIAGSDGLRLIVPAGAHGADTPYTVTARPVEGHGFDPGLVVHSPLYTVDNGGTPAAEVVTVEVPVSLPDGAFAMGFVYDEAMGTLEGMPILDLAADRVTLATRVFSSFVVLGFDAHAIGTLPPGPDVLDSGFRPGRDDWQFTNLGSVIAPSGHCAGQSLSALWYFVEERRREGASPLYGLYDNDGGPPTPAQWQDDRDGYRLASAAQMTYQTDPLARAYEASIDRLVLARFDALQYSSFATAIRVTGEPQLVGIMRTDPATGRIAGGHAMVVYRVTATELDVADPNYPGRYRVISYDPTVTRFSPYLSGPDATDLGREYAFIGFYGKRRFVDWSAVGGLWRDFEAGTVGHEVFWPYELQVEETDAEGNRTWVPLTDGMHTTSASITVRAVLPAGKDWRLNTVTLDGAWTRGDAQTPLAIPLAEGENLIRLYLQGAEENWTQWEYLDFRRFNVLSGDTRGPDLVATADPREVDDTLGTEQHVVVTVENRGSAPIEDLESFISGIVGCRADLGRIEPGASATYCCTFLLTTEGAYDREIWANGVSEDGEQMGGQAGVFRTVGRPQPGVTTPCDPTDPLCGLDTDA